MGGRLRPSGEAPSPVGGTMAADTDLARVAELADALALGASGETLEGSTPSSRTKSAEGGFDPETATE